MQLLRERKELQGELKTFVKGFSWQIPWSGLPLPTPGDLPDSGIKPVSLRPPASGGFFTAEPPGKPGKPYLTGDIPTI